MVVMRDLEDDELPPQSAESLKNDLNTELNDVGLEITQVTEIASIHIVKDKPVEFVVSVTPITKEPV